MDHGNMAMTTAAAASGTAMSGAKPTGSTTTTTAAQAAKAAYSAYKRHWNLKMAKIVYVCFFGFIVAIAAVTWLSMLWSLLHRRSKAFRRVHNALQRMTYAELQTPRPLAWLGARVPVWLSLAYIAFLPLILCANMVQTKDNTYRHNFNVPLIADRSGDIAACVLPLVFAMSLKNSPLALLLRSSHERLNAVHRWTGRTFIALGLSHLLLYVVKYTRSNSLARLKKTSNVYGAVALVAYVILGATAVAIARRRMYAWFYAIHWTMAVVGIAFTWLHDDKAVPYCKAAVAIFAFDVGARLVRRLSNPMSARVEALGPNVCRVLIDRPKLPLATLRNWHAGQHLFLTGYRFGGLEQHPFTIASLPEDGRVVLLVAREDNFTRRLLSKDGATFACGLDGPYGSSLVPSQFAAYDRVVLVAGGVGLSFTLPLLRTLLRDAAAGKTGPAEICFVWATREPEFFHHMRQALNELVAMSDASAVRVDLNLFLTRGAGILTDDEKAVDGTDLGVVREQVVVESGEEKTDVAIDVASNLSSPVSSPTGEKNAFDLKVSTVGDRPQLADFVRPATGATPGSRGTAIALCGGAQLRTAVKKLIAQNWPIDGRNGQVWLHSESFDL